MTLYTTLRFENPCPGVAVIRLNRPDRRNAFSRETFGDISQAIDQLDHDPAIRCGVIMGDGNDFSAGLDRSFLEQLKSSSYSTSDRLGPTSAILEHVVYPLQEVMTKIRLARTPLIAAIHGHCIGVALEMICACDIRLCVSGSTFSLKEVSLGLVADLGGLQLLPRIINTGLARELALTGRNMASAEALKAGLVTYQLATGPLMTIKALELANLIASLPSQAVAGTKRSIVYSEDRTIEDGMRYNALVASSVIDALRMNEPRPKL